MLQRGGEYYSLKRLLLDDGTIESGPRLMLDGAIASAAGNGHASILKLLLKRLSGPLTVPLPTSDAPIVRAAVNGDAETVTILLEHTAATQTSLPSGQAATDLSAEKADREAQITRLYSYALNEALRHAREKIVNLLLADGRVQLNSQSICAAAAGGSLKLVELCLQQAPAWSPGTGHESPLGAAARRGHEAAFTLISQSGEFDPNMTDEAGRTPLAVAAEHGQNRIVEILLGTPGVDADPHDKYDRTPLELAASKGNMVLVQWLLAIPGVDVNNCDSDHYIPISSAASSGKVDVVKQLLEAGADPDCPDDEGRTPLARAAYSGANEVVKVLLSTGKVQADSRDEGGMTPLMLAAKSGRFLRKPDDFVRTRPYELETEKVIVPLLKGEQPPPLNLKGLLLEPDVNRDISTRGALSVMEQLLARDDVDPNARDGQGRTALSYAAEMHEIDAIRALMEDGRVDVNCADNDGWTPMTWITKKVKDSPWNNDWEVYYGL
ncbi:Uncharacterized protein PECH_003548 [Penicillium ucsense]|uniref:Ankyrin repeat protein n=1 Tax=Penicillium ucsense TaxID=2839758 RepID=A0A8J8W0R7_9EURO|nr:Uncharacterized protein PECM_007437 [Penicillium ucsense]KAF7737628.1 Uncharacterized protein PECH_003548 [Penicillium ucsense]